jgi:predicted DNA-binding protein (MmcQ/YjbR family)
MTKAQFNQFCALFNASFHVVQWGGANVWKVGGQRDGKVFAICWPDSGAPKFTFKASELNYNILKDEPGYRPAPYFANRGMQWIQQYDHTLCDDEALKYYLGESYRLASLNLSKKRQRELGLNQESKS